MLVAAQVPDALQPHRIRRPASCPSTTPVTWDAPEHRGQVLAGGAPCTLPAESHSPDPPRRAHTALGAAPTPPPRPPRALRAHLLPDAGLQTSPNNITKQRRKGKKRVSASKPRTGFTHAAPAAAQCGLGPQTTGERGSARTAWARAPREGQSPRGDPGVSGAGVRGAAFLGAAAPWPQPLGLLWERSAPSASHLSRSQGGPGPGARGARVVLGERGSQAVAAARSETTPQALSSGRRAAGAGRPADQGRRGVRGDRGCPFSREEQQGLTHSPIHTASI